MQNKSVKCTLIIAYFKGIKFYIILNLQISISGVADDLKFSVFSKIDWHSGLCFSYCFPLCFFPPDMIIYLFFVIHTSTSISQIKK